MTQTTIYGLKNCDTCRKARKWLDAQGIDHHFVDYREQPVEAITLSKWAGQAGGWDRLVNRRSATWRQLSDAERVTRGDAAWTTLIAAHPALVKRPVLVDGEFLRVGFDEADWCEHFGQ